MGKVHNGVLIPLELHNATVAELDAFAASVKATNGAFIRAYFELADGLASRGIDIDEIGDTDIAVRARQERSV